MSLESILLGFLETPASGYDLKREFDATARFFWNAELSQIYPTLHRLRRQGLVNSSKSRSSKGPDREVYSRNPEGTKELREWLAAEPVVRTERFAYLAQLFFLGQMGDFGMTRDFLEQLRDYFGNRLEILRAIDEEERARAPGYPESLEPAEFHAYLTLLCGLTRTAASVTWCEESLRLLEGYEKRNATPGQTTRREEEPA